MSEIKVSVEERRPKNRRTVVSAYTGTMWVEVHVYSSMPLQHRRATAVALFRKIEDDLPFIAECTVNHSDGSWFNAIRSRQTVLRDSPDLSTLQGRIGFRFRSYRLRLGLSQTEFARKVRLSRPHLSRIERGLALPFPRTVSRLAHLIAPTSDLAFTKELDQYDRDLRRAYKKLQKEKNFRPRPNPPAPPKREFE